MARAHWMARARRVEGCQAAVAGALHQQPGEPPDLTFGHLVVLIEPLRPGPVPEQRRLLGRTGNVGEQYGGQRPVRRGYMTGPGQELLDFPRSVVSARPGDVAGGGKLGVAGCGDVLGEGAAVSGTDESVAPGVDDQRGYGQITAKRPHTAVQQHPPDRRGHSRAWSPVPGPAPGGQDGEDPAPDGGEPGSRGPGLLSWRQARRATRASASRWAWRCRPASRA